MYIHISYFFFVVRKCRFLFLLIFGNKKCTLKLHGLIFAGKKMLICEVIQGFTSLPGSATV